MNFGIVGPARVAGIGKPSCSDEESSSTVRSIADWSQLSPSGKCEIAMTAIRAKANMHPAKPSTMKPDLRADVGAMS
jgi:hypothetical protein